MWIETERLYIRELAEGDFDLMTSVWRERFPPLLIEDKAESGSFLQDLWEDNRTSDILTGLIFLREGNVFCGRVNIQNVEAEIPEVGIDILRDYKNHGYGPEAVTGFVNWYHFSHCVPQVKVRISSENAHSIHVFEKLGAEFVLEELMFSDKIQMIRESLPENEASVFADLKVREYILRLPIG
ncbi:GNAT family N-acetyltransferase [Oscillospiraceae bacterium 50-16]